MATSYTTLLGMALPVTGELQGTWGTTVNSYITEYVDSAVAGTQTISGSQTAVTLSKTTGASLTQAGSGATGSSQFAIINCTGNPAGLLTITAPAASQSYLVINGTSTSQSVKIVGAGPTTGVTLISGEKALVAWNGSDFVKVATTAAAGGSNTQVQYNNNGVLAGSAGLTWDGTTLVASNLTDSSLTSGRVVYATTSGNLTDSANLLFDGTTLTANALTTTSTVTINGGTANGVAYLNGSKVLTTGSALTFDGTNLKVGNATFAPNTNLAGNLLQLKSASGFAYLTMGNGDGANNTGYIGSASGLLTFGSVTDAGVTTEQMRLTSTGLGIGTSSPTVPLQVQKSVAGDWISKLVNSNATNGYGLYVQGAPNASTYLIGAHDGSSYGFVVTGDFKVGIGTSSPSAKLHVAGGARIADSTNSANYITIGSGNEAPYGNNSIVAQTGSFNIGTVAASTNLILLTAGTEKARLDSSGNLGLGVTPSAWDTSVKVMEFPSSSLAVYNGGITHNAFFDSVNSRWEYRNASSNPATFLNMQGGAFAFNIAGNGTQNNPITFTQAMTLDASGNLGVGTTSPLTKMHVQVSSLSGYTSVANLGLLIERGDGPAALNIASPNTESGFIWFADQDSATVGNVKYDHSNNAMSFATNGSERARITSGGAFCAGTTSVVTVAGLDGAHSFRTDTNSNWVTSFGHGGSTPYGLGILYISATPNGTGSEFLYCYDNAPALRMSVRSNGGIANYSANDVNLSDRREKTNFAPAKSYLDTICSIPVQTFNYVDQNMEDDPGLTLGVVAQDVQAVAPELVMESNWGTKDNPKMRLSIYQTDLQYALMKCIQELKSELDSVKAELATLKGV